MYHLFLELVGAFIFFTSILLIKPFSWPVSGALVGLALAASLLLTSGHLNPAVSTMLYLRDGFPVEELFGRIAAQAGAVALALLAARML